MLATPLKNSINIGTSKGKFSEQHRIQKYPLNPLNGADAGSLNIKK